MANSNLKLPQSFKFVDSGLRNFVQTHSFLNNTYQNYSPMPVMAQTHNNFTAKPMGFDTYNRNNLLLKSCNVSDIQYVQKNPLVFQQDIVVVAENKKVGAKPLQKQIEKEVKSKTTQNFYPPKPEDKNVKSKQAQMNDFLFNYRKQEAQKKNKKIEFLEEIQQKLKNLEKQAQEIEHQKQKQYEQIKKILKISHQNVAMANEAQLVGKLNQAIYESEVQKSQALSPRIIDENMGHLQINAAIQQQHQYNDELLQEIERFSKSKQKMKSGKRLEQVSPKKSNAKGDFGFYPPKNTFTKTVRRPVQAPPRPSSGNKKLFSTVKGK